VLIKQSLQRKEKGENKSKEREEARGERKKNLPLLSALYIILRSFLLKSFAQFLLNVSRFQGLQLQRCYSVDEVTVSLCANSKKLCGIYFWNRKSMLASVS
jgi:hypothetical protein